MTLQTATLNNFWSMVESCDWANDRDYNRINVGLLRQYSPQELDDFRSIFSHLQSQLAKASGKNYCYDGWDDCRAHIIGLGKQVFDAAIENPASILERLEADDYDESFSYCLPWGDDALLLEVAHYSNRARRLYKRYAKSLDAGQFVDDCQVILDSMELLIAQDVDGFLSRQAKTIEAAKTVSVEARKQIETLGGCGWIDGGSICNDAGVVNLFIDIKRYLKEEF